MPIINRNDEAIRVTFNVEHYSISADYAGVPIAPFYIRRVVPVRGLNLVEPGLECGLNRRAILAAPKGLDKASQGFARDNPH